MSLATPRRAVPSLLAAALVAVLAFCASPAHAAKGLEIGVQDDALFLSATPEVRSAAFAHARELGVVALRTNVAWSRVVSEPASPVAPAAPAYDFSAYDRLVDEAAANGIRVQLTLAGPAPAWATADHIVSNNQPDPARFGEFAGAVAAHFAGRVRAISIWNEPNWHGLLTPERICGKVAKAVKVKGKKGKKGEGQGAREEGLRRGQEEGQGQGEDAQGQRLREDERARLPRAVRRRLRGGQGRGAHDAGLDG